MDAECVVTLSHDDVLQRDEQFSRMAMWCHRTDSSAGIFLPEVFSSSRMFPKPSFLLVRLVDEVPEDVTELTHVTCMITFAVVAAFAELSV